MYRHCKRSACGAAAKRKEQPLAQATSRCWASLALLLDITGQKMDITGQKTDNNKGAEK